MGGVHRKPEPLELTGLLEKAVENEVQPGGRGELYYYLEEEKIPRELWPYILGFMTRTAKLTYLDDREVRYWRWKVVAHAARIQLSIDNLMPKPEQFPTLADYRRAVDALRHLPANLEYFMWATVKRAYHGFERKMEASRYFYVSR